MKRVDDFSNLSRLIMANMKPGVLTNSFISPDEFRAEIDAGTLYTNEWSGGLLLLRARDGRHLLTYYIRDADSAHEADLPPDTVIEITQKPGGNALAAKAVSYWTCFGFSPVLERIRMTRPADCDVRLSAKRDVRFAQPEDFDGAYTLLRDSFDMLTGCLPTERELRDDISRGCVLCAGADSIDGVLRVALRSSSVEIQHLAVREALRGRGIARTLLGGFIREFGNKKCVVWTRDGYVPAIRVYTAAGFAPDGWRSTVMVG